MQEEQNQPFDDMTPVPVTPAHAPPTDRGGDAPPKRETAWPTVLAVLAFVWGGFSLLSSGCMVAMSPFYGWMVSAMEDAFDDEERAMMEGMADLWWWWLSLGVVGAILAIMLIIAGVGLLKRRRRGVTLAKLWSLLVILQLLIVTPMNFMLMDYPSGAGATGPQMMGQIGGYIGAAFGFLVTLILPALYLIWFARNPIKREIAEWP